MTWADDHKAEAFVHRLRAEAAEGVKHFANLPHYAGSTKTALALTLLAYTAGKRDVLKPQAAELTAINKDLSWTKYELAKRDLDQEEVVRKLRLDLRWAKFQLGKKDDKDKELQKLRAELDAGHKSRDQKKENEFMSPIGSNGAAKVAESQKHTDDYDMCSLKEQLEHERFEKERYRELYESLSHTSIPDGHPSSEHFQAKVSALQDTIDIIEDHFKETCSQLQAQLAQAEQQVHEMKLKHAIEVREVEERFEQQANDHHEQLLEAQQKTAECEAEKKWILKEKQWFESLANSCHVQLLNTQQSKTECQAENHQLTREKSKLLEEKQLFEGLSNSRIIQLSNTQQKTAECQAENHQLIWEKKKLLQEMDKLKQSQQSQNGCALDNQRILELENRVKFLIQEKEHQHQEWQKRLWDAQNEKGASTKFANSSQANDTPSIHLQSIEKLEEKLAVIESKASKNEQNLKKKVEELNNKLAQLGPLERFLEDRDFSDEKRVHLSWDDMTYAVRAAAAGLSPQIRRTLGHSHSTYIVEEALRHGSKELVSFAHTSPGRFVLRFQFFEAVESIVDNILWEAQKFPSVRKMLQEDSTIVKTVLAKHAFK